MTSLLLRKRRIIRSNIPSTIIHSAARRHPVTAGVFAAVFAMAMPCSVLGADEGTAATLQNSRALMQSLRTGRPVAKPVAATPKTPAAKQVSKPVPPRVPQLRRSFQELPTVKRAAAQRPPVPPVPVLKATPPPVPPLPRLQPVPVTPNPQQGGAALHLNSVQQTGGQSSEPGVVQLPLELPPVDMTDVSPPQKPQYDQRDLSGKVHLGQLNNHGVVVNHPRRPDKTTRVQKIFGFDGTVVKNNFRRGTTKVRRRAERLSRPFIERYDPNDHTDDYKMPILLIAAQDEAEPVVQSEGSELLPRKLSDIKPTLEYAWGDLTDEQLPDDFHKRMDNGPFIERFSPRTVVQWHPTNLWYYPLYFEDPGLERYGHTRRPLVQPFFSAGRFLGQVVGLPYQTTLKPPLCPEYALGYYQPGEWAPKKKYQVPWNEEAAATEFLWICGFILLVP